MRGLKPVHYGLIAAAFVLIVLFGFVSTTPDPEKQTAPVVKQSADSPDLDALISAARKRFSPEVQTKVAQMEAAISTERNFVSRGQMFDSLSRIATNAREYVFAAWVYEQKAIRNNGSGSDWYQAGERYRSAVSFQQDEKVYATLYEAAIHSYQTALDMEPKNSDAKVGIGICLVQSSGDPMKGIGLLLEVAEQDSTNVNAQLALGDFSVQRGAPDKAIVRYAKALQLRPDYYGLHLSLAEQFEALGQTDSAISHLEAYVKIETDPLMKNDVENALLQLRSKKNQQIK
jgi:tetratricopeptide (TPR) repeat protein